MILDQTEPHCKPDAPIRDATTNDDTPEIFRDTALRIETN